MILGMHLKVWVGRGVGRDTRYALEGLGRVELGVGVRVSCLLAYLRAYLRAHLRACLLAYLLTSSLRRYQHRPTRLLAYFLTQAIPTQAYSCNKREAQAQIAQQVLAFSN